MGVSRRTKLLDKLHRGTVSVLFITSGVLLICIGQALHQFITVTAPYYREKRRQFEQELLAEGKAPEEEFSTAQ